jgi:plasmid stabilization system protein ParE
MKVRFTRTALRDLGRIHDYISQDSPAVALRITARLIERSRQLADNPFEGRETDEPAPRVIIEPRLRYFFTPLPQTKSTLATSAIHRASVHGAGINNLLFATPQ